MYMKHLCRRRRLTFLVEAMEVRRLFTDLAFGNFALSGDPLFHPGGTTVVTVQIRDLDGVGVAAVERRRGGGRVDLWDRGLRLLDLLDGGAGRGMGVPLIVLGVDDVVTVD